MTDTLADLRAIVTGGASGIGLATAQLLHAHGAAVVVLDLDPSGVPEPLIGLRADSCNYSYGADPGGGSGS